MEPVIESDGDAADDDIGAHCLLVYGQEFAVVVEDLDDEEQVDEVADVDDD